MSGATFLSASQMRRAQLFIPSGSIEKLMGGAAFSRECPDVFPDQMQILVGKLTFVQTASMGRVGIKWTPG